MKTIFVKKGGLIKTILSLVLMLAVLPVLSYGQEAAAKPDKKEADIKRLEAALNTAKTNLAKAEKQVAINDSLIENGKQMQTEAAAEKKQLDAENKQKEKDSKAAHKPLEKQLKSKDKDEVKQATAEIKKLDTQEKADVKDMENKYKAADKKVTTGAANEAKGKTGKKPSAENLKKAQAAYDAAQAKLDAAKGGDAPVADKKGKKKK